MAYGLWLMAYGLSPATFRPAADAPFPRLETSNVWLETIQSFLLFAYAFS
jgi:hypothetical protein